MQKEINNLEESIKILEEYDNRYVGSKRHIVDVNLLSKMKKDIEENKNGKSKRIFGKNEFK